MRESNVGTGNITISGNRATVVLTGTFCDSGNERLLNTFQSQDFCRTNTDRTALLPVFTLDLSRTSNGDWSVIFGQ
jgi:hypothetical protein